MFKSRGRRGRCTTDWWEPSSLFLNTFTNWKLTLSSSFYSVSLFILCELWNPVTGFTSHGSDRLERWRDVQSMRQQNYICLIKIKESIYTASFFEFRYVRGGVPIICILSFSKNSHFKNSHNVDCTSTHSLLWNCWPGFEFGDIISSLLHITLHTINTIYLHIMYEQEKKNRINIIAILFTTVKIKI